MQNNKIMQENLIMQNGSTSRDSFVLQVEQAREERERYYRRSKRISIATIIILLICLILAYLAWALADAVLPGSQFQFGTVGLKIEYKGADGTWKTFDPGENLFNVGIAEGSHKDALINGKGLIIDDTVYPYVITPKPDSISKQIRVTNVSQTTNNSRPPSHSTTTDIGEQPGIDEYYRVHFSNIDVGLNEGEIGMGQYVEVTILESSSAFTFNELGVATNTDIADATCISKVRATDMTDERLDLRADKGVIGELAPGETKYLLITLTLPDDPAEYRITGDSYMTFDINVEAVQTRNNAEKEFD